MIKADLQILMRIFVGGRNDKNIEADERLSKYNYGWRKYYLINTAILEKRLIYDTSVRDGKPILHNILDLKACYNRQLLNIGYMVQELISMQREVAKVF